MNANTLNKPTKFARKVDHMEAMASEAAKARQEMTDHLAPAAEVISNLLRKKMRTYSYSSSQALPEELRWVTIYRNPDAKFSRMGSNYTVALPKQRLAHSISTKQDETFLIDKVFFTGSNWDVAKYTRRAIYRFLKAQRTAEAAQCAKQVADAQKALKQAQKDAQKALEHAQKGAQRAQQRLERFQRRQERAQRKQQEVA